MKRGQTRRRVCGLVALAGLSGLGGCLTTDIGVETPGIESSDVFESVTRTESWATSTTRVDVTLTTQATRDLGVAELVVMKDGSDFYTTELKPTATAATVVLPTTGTATVVAVDGLGSVVAEQEMSVTGGRFP
ncbi:hypothetical protein [Haloarchaeobius sp. DFWS5]|uniref:hypothetical protein n=1 Tax=Haloarchaeobius sp. DFWS5 TaxID=3446114 RepID=UPI003EB9C1A6